MNINDVIKAITVLETILNIVSILEDMNTIQIFTALIMFIVVYSCLNK